MGGSRRFTPRPTLDPRGKAGFDRRATGSHYGFKVKLATYSLRFAFCLWCVMLCCSAPAQTTNSHFIDLPTALKLAGAQSLDVRIARERLMEAKASHAGAMAQFF